MLETITCPDCLIRQTENSKNTEINGSVMIKNFVCVKCGYEWIAKSRVKKEVTGGKYISLKEKINQNKIK